MSIRDRILMVGLILVLAASPVMACYWDWDTLRQERRMFPSTLELITGKFLRHSPEFYQWRIDDRLRKLQSDPRNLDYHDDLAVAYQKTGQHEKAIAILEQKEKIRPGLYKTYSNLGTVYIIAGDFERGLPFIDRALTINPNAHFGRERYQKWLVEYAMAQRRDGKLQFPMRSTERKKHEILSHANDGFLNYVKAKLGKEYLDDTDASDAVKGVLGMMRFANHDNPLLLEALGDVLLHQNHTIDAKQLAARAYLSASYQMEDETSKTGYRLLAEMALSHQLPMDHLPKKRAAPPESLPSKQGPESGDVEEKGSEHGMKLADLETAFAAERADADAWYSELRSRELGWIREGKDADAEFDREYDREPYTQSPLVSPWLTLEQKILVALFAFLSVPVLMALGFFFWVWRSARAGQARAMRVSDGAGTFSSQPHLKQNDSADLP